MAEEKIGPTVKHLSQCEDCAFRQGSETQEHEPHNRLKGELCLLGGIVFYCHHGFDWQNPEAHKLTRRDVQQQGGKPCVGWVVEVKKLAARGYFTEYKAVKRGYAKAGLKMLTLFTAKNTSPTRKKWALRRLTDILMALYRSAGFTQVVTRERR